MLDTQDRIFSLEQASGRSLPETYRRFLETHVEDPNRLGLLVSTNPNYWGVRNVFELGSAGTDLQVDQTYRILEDVLPTGMVPIADDSAGNLYLLDCRSGAVFWWDHEQAVSEHRVEAVAGSFEAFRNVLVPDPQV